MVICAEENKQSVDMDSTLLVFAHTSLVSQLAITQQSSCAERDESMPGLYNEQVKVEENDLLHDGKSNV